jgi:hypothetical protein
MKYENHFVCHLLFHTLLCFYMKTVVFIFSLIEQTLTNYFVLYSYNRMGEGIQIIYYVAFTNLVAGCCLVLAEWQAAGVQILLQRPARFAWCWLSGMHLVWCLIPPTRWRIKIKYSHIG